MLPQDTCGLLPWRVTVPVLQVSGCFPYKLCATSGPPVFSLPLLLWSVFVHLFLTCQSIVAYTKVFLLYSAPDLGTVFYLCCVIVMMVAVTLTPFFMAIKSSKLSALLHDMSHIVGVPREYNTSPKNLVIMSTMVIFLVFATWFATAVLELKVYESVMVFIWSLSWNLSIFMPDSCFSSLLDLLTRYLLQATTTTVAAVSKLLGPDGSFSGEEDVEAALLALRDLESLIRQVAAWQEAVKQCFFPAITLYLWLGVLMAIVCPYAILKGTYMGGTTFVSVCFSFYLVGQCSYLGQTFIDKVSVAEKQLMDLKMRSKHTTFCIKVSGVMARLSPLLTFNMCGWYTLSYSSFLGLVNTILTYLAIILQVGGNDISEFTSSSNKVNSEKGN